MASKYSVGVVISAMDKATAPIRKVVGALEAFKKTEGIQRISQALNGVNNSFKNVIDQTGLFAARLGLLAGAGALAFKALFLDSALEFEKFSTVLTGIEGTSEKAKKSMSWISQFASTTPYDLKEVTQAFVQLRAYGMEPQGGLLRGLGDAAAGMNKGLMQSVEMIADAVTGENERLKEFGIKARAVGKQFVYEYTQNGKTMTKTAAKNSREQIQKVLLSIFNSKYAGQMDNLSKTFGGMLSNLGDQWTRLSMMVMDEGLFNFLKGELETLMGSINDLMVDPAFIAQVKVFAQDLKQLFVDLKVAAVQIWPEIVKIGGAIKGTAAAVGGYANLLKIIIGLMAVPLVTAIISFVGSIGSAVVAFAGWAASTEMAWAGLGLLLSAIELLSGPIGWTIAAITILGGLGALIYSNWGAVSSWFANMWQEWGGLIRLVAPPIGAIVDLAQLIQANWGPITGFFTSVCGTIQEAFQIAGAIIMDIWDGITDKVMGVINLLRTFSSWLPNNNTLMSTPSPSIGQSFTGGFNMAPAVNMNGAGANKLTAVVQPKKDMLDVALKVDFVGGTAQVASAKNRGDSNMKYKFEMGLMNA